MFARNGLPGVSTLTLGEPQCGQMKVTMPTSSQIPICFQRLPVMVARERSKIWNSKGSPQKNFGQDVKQMQSKPQSRPTIGLPIPWFEQNEEDGAGAHSVKLKSHRNSDLPTHRASMQGSCGQRKRREGITKERGRPALRGPRNLSGR